MKAFQKNGVNYTKIIKTINAGGKKLYVIEGKTEANANGVNRTKYITLPESEYKKTQGVKQPKVVDPVIEQMKKDLAEMNKQEALKQNNKVANKSFLRFTENVYRRKVLGDGIRKRFIVQEYAVTESTFRYLSDELFKIIRNERFKIQQNPRFRAGFRMFPILKCCDDIKEKWISFPVRGDNNNLTLNNVEDTLMGIINKHHDTANYIVYLHSMEILFTPLDVAGGCCERHKTKREKLDKDTTIIIKSYQSKNNNCLIQCFNQFYEVKNLKAETVRKDLNIPEGMIDFSMIPKMSEYYNSKYDKQFGYQVINDAFEFLSFKTYGDNDYIKILLRDEHYFVYDYINYKQCKECGRKLRDDNDDHKCNFQMRNFRRMKKKDKTFVRYMNIAEDKKIEYDNIVHWDLETFKENKNIHTPYASGYSNGNNVIIHYGKDAMKNTVDEFATYKNKIISAYNGSGFDFYFLVEALTDRGIKVENMINSNGKLMSFTFGDGNKVFDLCLYLTCKLEKACKDFKVKNSKSSFEHEKMNTWDDVETYRNEVEPYLRLDVLALKEVFETFNDMMFDRFKVNITSYMSAGQLGYSIWLSTIEDDIEVPDLEKYDFIKLATYGARCYPQKKKYQSREYKNLRPIYDKVYELEVKKHKDELLNKKENVERIISVKIDNEIYNNKCSVMNSIVSKFQIKPTVYTKLYNKLKESKDFIFNADATSLYPASMAGFDLVKVEYPLGRSRWSEQPEKEFNNNKIGVYEIEFVAPKKLRVPILPTRRMNGNRCVGINWTLLNGSGMFSSVDIKNAIECGYQVKFINKCLVWDKSGDVFGKYIKMFYQMKEESERNKNDVARSVAKLFLNSLYGKTLQKANVTNNTIVNNLKEFNAFVRDYELTSFHLYNNKMLVTGDAKDKQKKVTKPSQLGCFVTAYSRKIMLTYMKAIDPTLSTCVFTYSDTDSMHMSGEAYEKLKALGYIKDKKNSQLGYLCSDIDDEGIIFNEINLAPKCYLYEYINNKGEIKEDNKATMKCKGIVKKELRADLYKEEKKEELSFTSLRKKHNKLTTVDVENGINHFNIIQLIQKRTFNNSEWQGMEYVNGEWFPFGFQH